MKIKTSSLLLNAVNNHSHPREIGRYWASEIYSIRKGYKTAQDFFNSKPIDIIGARNILSGEAFETKWKEILEANNVKFSYGNDIKKEIKITNNIILVVKLDFLMENWGLETKYPTRETNEIPAKWKDQLECEYQAYKIPIYLGVFRYPFMLKYFHYKPSKTRWNKIQDILISYDKQVRDYKEHHIEP